MALRHGLGQDLDDVGADGPSAVERNDAGAATATARCGGGGLGCGAQTLGGEIGGVREAGGVADHDPDAGAPVATRRQLLDLAVVEHRR